MNLTINKLNFGKKIQMNFLIMKKEKMIILNKLILNMQIF